MKLNFTKMQGIGNDYIYFDSFKQHIENSSALAVKLSDRHFGIGGDGIVLICPSEVADARMRMFNADGSEGKMCGNAIRCVGKYLYENGYINGDAPKIETASGIKKLRLNIRDGKVLSATVDMGAPIFTPRDIPCKSGLSQVVDYPLEVGGKVYDVTALSMGNPHCVAFMKTLDGLDINDVGAAFEKHEFFPDRVNAEFVEVLSLNVLKMRVYERGSGETLACGTGACAAAVAAVVNGYAQENADITVKLRGGDLIIKYTGNTVYLTGTADKVFCGEIEVDE